MEEIKIKDYKNNKTNPIDSPKMKYDELNEEWITTQEWNTKKRKIDSINREENIIRKWK